MPPINELFIADTKEEAKVAKKIITQNTKPEKGTTIRLDKSGKRISYPYQLIGLEIAEMLDDRNHKSLYIKLAKENDKEVLLTLAKESATRPKVKNKGAYFMKLLQKSKDENNNN